MKTDKEINAEIAKLKELKPKVRRMNHFGDDNHAAIDAQIAALESRWSEDDIWDEWPEEDGEESRERDNARDAINWMTGDSDEVPSDGWAPLAE